MESARLASKQQASPAGPFSGPRATGVPKTKKRSPRYPGWCCDHRQSPNHQWDPEGPCISCQSAPCARLAAPGPSRPKTAQHHHKRAPAPPWADPEGSVVQADGQNQLGYGLGYLLAMIGPVWPGSDVRWAQNGFIWAPTVSCGLKLKKWPYPGLDGTNCESVDTLPTCKPPL